MDHTKLDFIINETIARLKDISPATAAQWGKMNVQQMVEHLSDIFKAASSKKIYPLMTPVEQLPKYKEFLLSDKPFRENTKAPVDIIPDEPFTERRTTYKEAIDELQNDINDFVNYFKNDPTAITRHPVFGDLNFEEWVLFQYKHVTHHLRQFSLL